VMRTPFGKPVGQDQVALLVEGVARGLAIEPQDILLDLCCGNGAITDPLFARCRGGVGVDFTPYLIEVAKTNFEKPPERLYRLGDVLDYVETTEDTEHFTKVMCYGAFQCLIEEKAARVLAALRERFPNVQRVFLGNLPDLSGVELFWQKYMGRETPSHSELKRHDTLIGIWRDEMEIAKLAEQSRWQVQISRMPPAYYGADVRFDAILTPI